MIVVITGSPVIFKQQRDWFRNMWVRIGVLSPHQLSWQRKGGKGCKYRNWAWTSHSISGLLCYGLCPYWGRKDRTEPLGHQQTCALCLCLSGLNQNVLDWKDKLIRGGVFAFQPVLLIWLNMLKTCALANLLWVDNNNIENENGQWIRMWEGL